MFPGNPSWWNTICLHTVHLCHCRSLLVVETNPLTSSLQWLLPPAIALNHQTRASSTFNKQCRNQLLDDHDQLAHIITRNLFTTLGTANKPCCVLPYLDTHHITLKQSFYSAQASTKSFNLFSHILLIPDNVKKERIQNTTINHTSIWIFSRHPLASIRKYSKFVFGGIDSTCDRIFHC